VTMSYFEYDIGDLDYSLITRTNMCARINNLVI
jgi:hypothetical protein